MFLRRLTEYVHFLKSLCATNIRLLWGMWKLTIVPHPAITFFGGSRVTPESAIAQKAQTLAKMLAQKGFSIITGGGPGIMEAANLGALESLKECQKNSTLTHKTKIISVGIGLIHLNKDRSNPYVQKSITLKHFFARKWLLVRYSVGFIIFPGGFGTLDELSEIITLIQCNRMKKTPVILIDRAFWKPLMEWIENSALPAQLIDEKDRAIIKVTDDLNEAVNLIAKECGTQKKSFFMHTIDEHTMKK